MTAPDPADLSLADLDAVAEAAPLVNAVTNNVTVNDVAQVILHWGGLPVMSDDEREVGTMVAGADACLLNMGTVSQAGEATTLGAGESANEHGVPVVVDPVGVGATPTRDRVAERLVSELDVAAIKGNYGEITALTGEDAEVRGVESVGEYSDIAATAVACAQAYGTVVVASGETDIVATGEAALLGTAAFGLAGEAAADGGFGAYHGPASYHVAFKDAIAGLRDADTDGVADRVERV